MSEPGTVDWRALWSDAEAIVGDRTKARWLCEVASGMGGDEFRASLDEPATERMVAHLDAMLARLRTGEPLQYVLGTWAFRHLELMIDRRVLIPRPETEFVVDVALELCKGRQRPIRLADLGTGCGAIGLSLAFELAFELARELPRGGVEVWLTDVSVDALDVARANLAGLGRSAANVRIADGDWFEALPMGLVGSFDVIVSNPPYVCDDDPELEASVRDWEPSPALYGGPNGLDQIERLVAGAPRWLRGGGWLVLEIGASQGTAVRALFEEHGFDDIVVRPDLAGRDRVAIGRSSA